MWTEIKATIRHCVEKSGINPRKISGFGVAGFGETVIPVGRDAREICPAIDWRDARSRSYKAETDFLGKEIGAFHLFEITGCPLSYNRSVTKLMWLKKNKPGVYKKTWKFLAIEDFVNWKLTGQAATDHSVASCTMLFDIRRKEWSSEILQTTGIDQSLLPEVYRSDAVIGEVQKKASEDTRLPEGTPVVAGGIDQNCGALGAGVIDDGVAIDSTGTVECLAAATQKLRTDKMTMLTGQHCGCHVVENMYLRILSLPTSGIILKWFRDNFCQRETKEAEKTGVDVYDLLVQEAAGGKPGAYGLFMLPHFGGSGSGQPPVFNPTSRGAFIGLRLVHKKRDFIRALLEGIAFEARIFVEKMEETGVKVCELRAIGGGAKSRPWLQLKANVFNRKVVVPEITEAPALGAALLAGVGNRTYESITEAVEQTYRKRVVCTPDQIQAKQYQNLYDVYKKIYPSLCPMFNEITRLEPEE
jgi:xylulokinase